MYLIRKNVLRILWVKSQTRNPKTWLSKPCEPLSKVSPALRLKRMTVEFQLPTYVNRNPASAVTGCCVMAYAIPINQGVLSTKLSVVEAATGTSFSIKLPTPTLNTRCAWKLTSIITA